MEKCLMELHINTMPAPLSPGLTLRPARFSDADAVSHLTAAYWMAMGDGVLSISPDEMRRFWNSPGLSLETDTWVVETAEGRIVGYEEFFNRHDHAVLVGEGYVHPDFQRRGIGTVLLQQLVHRAGQESALAAPGARVFLRNGVSAADASGRGLHETEGFRPIRHSWRMQIQVAEPRSPIWPDGLSLQPFDRAVHDPLLFEAHELAFADHFGHTPFTLETWQHHVSGRQDFNPGLWHVAWHGALIAGYSICNSGQGVGWVDKLGVLPQWRRRGLGLALLEHSFNAFLQRGLPIVTLGVDAANPTGATRLYERAGMRVASEIIRYEKELRPGQPS
jgi:mycothiol synthase